MEKNLLHVVVLLFFLRDFYQWECGLSLEFGLGKFRNLRRNIFESIKLLLSKRPIVDVNMWP